MSTSPPTPTDAPPAPAAAEAVETVARANSQHRQTGPGDAAEVPAAAASIAQWLGDLQALTWALGALAGTELQLSAARLLRATLLAAIGLSLVLIGVGLVAALCIAMGLAMGLGWPAALASTLGLILATAWLCRRLALSQLRACGLPQTRAQLDALWPGLGLRRGR